MRVRVSGIEVIGFGARLMTAGRFLTLAGLFVVADILAHGRSERADGAFGIREGVIVLLDGTPNGMVSVVKVVRIGVVPGGAGHTSTAKHIDGIDGLVHVADSRPICLVRPARKRRRDETLLDGHCQGG